MDRIPILKMDQFLLVTIQVDMHDRLAMQLQDDLTQRIVATRARGVLIDISSLEVVDSFIGRMISNIAGMARVLDAETVVTGMQPAASSSCSPKALAMDAWWAIMPSMSRRPDNTNSSPTLKRCSGALPAPTRRMPATIARGLRNG